MAALRLLAERTASTPERVARGIIHAALWREPESLLQEVTRLALEAGMKIPIAEEQSDEDSVGEGE